MPDENRIESTQPAQSLYTPAAGGWTPAGWKKLALTCVAGAGTALGAAVIGIGDKYVPGTPVAQYINPFLLSGAAISGCFGALITHLGLTSAGTRKL